MQAFFKGSSKSSKIILSQKKKKGLLLSSKKIRFCLKSMFDISEPDSLSFSGENRVVVFLHFSTGLLIHR